MKHGDGKYYLLNNRLLPIEGLSVDHIANGFSVYEIVRVEDYIAIFLEDHLRRLYQSLELEKLRIKENEQEIKQQVRKLTVNNPVSSGKIKIVVQFYSYRPSPEYSLWLYFNYYDPPTKQLYRTGVATILCHAERHEPNAKLLHTEARIKADNKIREASVYEAMLVDGNGYVTEGSRSNVFFISGDLLVTPPDEAVLPGIVRSKIMEICHEHHLNLQRRKIHKDELPDFDSAFLSGTTPKILPVRSIDDITFSVNNSLMAFLMQTYDNKIEHYIQEHKSYKIQ